MHTHTHIYIYIYIYILDSISKPHIAPENFMFSQSSSNIIFLKTSPQQVGQDTHKFTYLMIVIDYIFWITLEKTT